MAGRYVCIWKAFACESIHLYYARALAYLPLRVPFSRGNSTIFLDFRWRRTARGTNRETICQIFTVCHSRWPPHLTRRPFPRFLILGVTRVRTTKRFVESMTRWKLSGFFFSVSSPLLSFVAVYKLFYSTSFEKIFAERGKVVKGENVGFVDRRRL